MVIQNLRETSIMLSFSMLPDPRRNRNQLYSMFDIITVTVTLNLLKEDKKTKAGIKNKRSKAGWDKDYMLKILRMEF